MITAIMYWDIYDIKGCFISVPTSRHNILSISSHIAKSIGWKEHEYSDPLGHIHTWSEVGNDHYIHTCCQFVHPHFSKSSETKQNFTAGHVWVLGNH